MYLGINYHFLKKLKNPRQFSSEHKCQQSIPNSPKTATTTSTAQALQTPHPHPQHTYTHLVLGLLADQPEEKKVVTGDVHFWESLQVTLQSGRPLGLGWGLPHG